MSSFDTSRNIAQSIVLDLYNESRNQFNKNFTLTDKTYSVVDSSSQSAAETTAFVNSGFLVDLYTSKAEELLDFGELAEKVARLLNDKSDRIILKPGELFVEFDRNTRLARVGTLFLNILIDRSQR